MGLRGARAPSTGSMWRMFLCPHESLLDDRHRWCLLGFLWPMKPLRGQLTGFGGQRASNMSRCVLQQWELLKEFYCRLLSKMTRLWNGYKAAATSRPMASPVPFFTFFHSGIDWGLGAFLCVFHTFCPGSSVIPQSETCTSGWMEMLKRPEWLLSQGRGELSLRVTMPITLILKVRKVTWVKTTHPSLYLNLCLRTTHTSVMSCHDIKIPSLQKWVWQKFVCARPRERQRLCLRRRTQRTHRHSPYRDESSPLLSITSTTWENNPLPSLTLSAGEPGSSISVRTIRPCSLCRWLKLFSPSLILTIVFKSSRIT